MEDKFKCRVCGLRQFPDLPWGEDGRQPSYTICDCCGVEFGYGDDGLQNCLRLRRRWVEVENCRWFSPKLCPRDWNLPAQIRAVPAAFKSDDDETLIRAYLKAGEQTIYGLPALTAI